VNEKAPASRARRLCRLSRVTCHARAALLLEVIVALTIMVAAMGILGAQLISGLRITEEAETQTRAAQLADRILTLLELDLQTVERFFAERTVEGDFGLQYPGWFWRAQVEQTDTPGLGLVSVEVLRQPDYERRDSIEGATVVRQMHLLKADPGRIDLARDFGYSQEQIELITSTIPIPGFDPANVNPQELVALDPATLLELLPALLPLLQQYAGGGMPLPDNLPPELRELLGGAGGDVRIPRFRGVSPGGASAIGGGGNPQTDMLRDLIRSRLGDQITDEQLDQLLSNMGGGGPRRGGGMGGRGGGPDRGGSMGGADGGALTGPPRGGPRRGGAGGGRGDGTGVDAGGNPDALDISEIDRLRNERNNRRGGGGRRGGG